MINPVELGLRLKAARERCALSQQEVADALSIPRTALTNIEAGSRSVSTVELGRLAELYGRDAASLIAARDNLAEALSTVLPRALPDIQTSPAFAAAVNRILELCREGARLRSKLYQRREPSIANYSAAVTSTADALKQAETVAASERRRLGLGNAPVGNLAELMSAEGIWTVAAELPDDISGLFVNHGDIGTAILVNDSHSLVRRRFSYAHEFAHALFDRAEIVTATRRANATALVEKRANAFAAAFLMPSEGVTEQLLQLDKGNPSRLTQTIFDVANDSMSDAEVRPAAGSQTITYQDVATIARHFGASYEAAAWRLRSLNRLSQTEAQTLVGQREVGNRYLSLLAFHEVIGNDPPVRNNDPAREQELRSQLVRLAVEAYRREEISVGRLTELADKIHLPVDDMLYLAHAVRAGGPATGGAHDEPAAAVHRPARK
jgi:Zn-dependent peptidase ImmA (M78 family)/transcriptional regulator with XRE-family HTH domain